MDSDITVYDIVANMIYFVLALIAMWGAFCVVMVWMRVSQKRFRNERSQDEFLDALEEPVSQNDYDAALEICEGSSQAMPQLAQIAIVNRDIGYAKVRHLVLDRFQRDVLSDLEHRLTWVNTVIKSAPMVGLLGTVVGMMGAFAKLAASSDVKPDALAENISVALITTACGLAIAIPLVICIASINVRIRKMEDLVEAGLTRFLDTLRSAMSGGTRET